LKGGHGMMILFFSVLGGVLYTFFVKPQNQTTPDTVKITPSKNKAAEVNAKFTNCLDVK
jgi:hypothetical protein